MGESNEGNQVEQRNTILPGILFVAIVALIAYLIGTIFPLIGGAVSGILLGIIISHVFRTPGKLLAGIDFTLKTLLKVAIILLGFSFSLIDILSVGKSSIIIVIVTVLSGLIFTYYIGRLFGLHENASLLIGAGTAICGATAIVTLAPVIKAREEQLTYAINTIFLFNIIAILTLPFIASLFDMSDHHFGIWAGAAIHDTSSVVAAGYAYSDEAGAVSVVVKLARTLMLIPLVIMIAIFESLRKRRAVRGPGAEKVNILKVFPYFILIFVGVVLVNSFVPLPKMIPHTAALIAKFVIVMVMVSVGLKTNLRSIIRVGYKPLVVGLIASVLISLVSLSLIYVMG